MFLMKGKISLVNVLLISTWLIIGESAILPEKTTLQATDESQTSPLTREEKLQMLQKCANILKSDNSSRTLFDTESRQSLLRTVNTQHARNTQVKPDDQRQTNETKMSSLDIPMDTKYTLSFLADWNAMRTKNFRREWKRILRGREDSRLNFPTLYLNFAHSSPATVALYFRRNGTKLIACGGYHETIHENEKALLKVSLKMDLFVKTRRGFEVMWTQERYVSMTRNPADGQECTLQFEFNDMPFKELAPRVPRALMTIMERENYNFRGLPVLPLPSHELFIMNWNAAKSFRNYEVEWKKMLRDEKDVWLHFFPLEMRFVDGSFETVNLFFGRRKNILKLYGGHYEWVEENLRPLMLFFKIDMFFTKQNGAGYFRTQQQGITMRKKDKRGWYSLLVFLDIPWNELSTTVAPRAEITLDESISHSVFGLPSRPMPMEQPYRIDWNLIKSMKDYQIEWERLIRGLPEAQLHFCPMEIFDSDNETTTVLVLFLVRRASHLWLVGGHYEDADEEVQPLTVSVKLNLTFKKKTGEAWNKLQTKTVTMVKKYPKGWVSLFPISGIPWQELSHRSAPIAIITLSHPQ
jgi:hypothetical protein